MEYYLVLQFFSRLMVVVGFVGSQCGGSVPSSQLLRMLPPSTPMLYEGNILSLSSRRSRNLFLGNMPDTACLMICRSRQHIDNNSAVVGTHLVRLSRLHIPVRCLLQPSWVHRVLPVQQLLILPPCNFNISRVGHNHVVPTVH